MKIVGIATSVRITDYSLPYSLRTDSLVDTMAFPFSLFSFTHTFTFLSFSSFPHTLF